MQKEKNGHELIVKFKITKAELSFVNIDSKTIVEPGNFEIKIGKLKAGFELTPNP